MIKQVIVMRRDLKMRRGKEIAQGAHASMMFLSHYHELERQGLYKGMTLAERDWMKGTFTKVCLQVHSEEELLDIFSKAKNAGLKVNLVTDAGKTEFNGVPTRTCLAIGPDTSENIDPITAHLKLY